MAYNGKDGLHKKDWGNKIRFEGKDEWTFNHFEHWWWFVNNSVLSQRLHVPFSTWSVDLLLSVWLLFCSVSPPGGRCRTTAALWPVFWGVRPIAVVSPGTWTMLLFLTFLTWVALHPQEAEAVMWAEFLLGCFFCHPPSFLCTSSHKEGWLHTVFVSEVNLCVDCGD